MISAEGKKVIDLAGAEIDVKSDKDPFSGVDSNKKREILN